MDNVKEEIIAVKLAFKNLEDKCAVHGIEK